MDEEIAMSEFNTNERVLRTDITMEECKQIEKVLRKNNISYYERWKTHSGIFKLFGNKTAKCDILIHMDSYETAKRSVGEKVKKGKT